MNLILLNKPILIDRTIFTLLMYVNYKNTVKPEQSVIEAKINSIVATNTLLSSIAIGAMSLLIFPLFCFLKKRLPLHYKVYDLFASVNSLEIQ
jgi:hypothetical protein